MRFVRQFILILCLFAGVRSASAFALLGPFAPWMTAQLSYQDGVSIGGPMNIGEGYRWNVPVLTYGYDQSFLDFFGTNGVAAVDAAIQILNNLPPASQIILTNYPLDSSKMNYQASAQSLLDLKSSALSLLVEHLGLAQPTRFVYCVHDFTISSGMPVYTILNRNFDPITLESTNVVNGCLLGDELTENWTYGVYESNYWKFQGQNLPFQPVLNVQTVAVEVNPGQGSYLPRTAVADNLPVGIFDLDQNYYPEFGNYFTGLTQDDVGGLGYLLSSNNYALESLIPGVQGVGTNASNFVNTALRPGVEKITFQRVDYISGTSVFPAFTNQYVDSYYTNGVLQQQTLQRVITQPDILFTANYIGLNEVSRSGTTNWINNGALNADGPGVIQPPVVLNFNRLGPSLYIPDPNYDTNTAEPLLPIWASFDSSTNAPLIYPALSVSNCTKFFFILESPLSFPSFSIPQKQFSWNLTGSSNAVFSLQTSTDLQDWLAIGAITNQGGTFTYFDVIQTNTPQRFFRTVPQ